jgi:hypothetical protein
MEVLVAEGKGVVVGNSGMLAGAAIRSDLLAIGSGTGVGVAKLAAGRLCGRRNAATRSPASSATPKTTL